MKENCTVAFGFYPGGTNSEQVELGLRALTPWNYTGGSWRVCQIACRIGIPIPMGKPNGRIVFRSENLLV